MYVIIVYDVEVKRVTRVLNFLRKYLHWVQNSVFEGELKEGKFKEVQIGLKKRIWFESHHSGIEITMVQGKRRMEQDVRIAPQWN
jgi:CRISPR-associated endonuclease Cas2